MLHYAPAPAVSHKPTLPLELERYGDPDGPSFDTVVQSVLSMAETEDLASFRSYTDRQGYVQLRGSALDLFLTAIDPGTGDSTIHRAAAAGNIDALIAVQKSFGRGYAQTPTLWQEHWLLITHQNLAGDTALHAAARTGQLKSLKALYRSFHRTSLSDIDDSLHDDPSSWLQPAGSDMWQEHPVESWPWTMHDDDPLTYLPPLEFLGRKNRSGRDAAAEARFAGHEDLGTWLDELVARNDRDGLARDEAYMRKARQVTLEKYFYHDDTEQS
jgi:hypothetical protein